MPEFRNADPAILDKQPFEAAWWQQFGDPTLDGLIERALAGDLDLKIAAARVDEARALLRAARRERWPGASVQAAHSESNAQQPGFTDERVDVESYDAGIATLWELDLFGRVRRGVGSRGRRCRGGRSGSARRAGARRGRGREQLSGSARQPEAVERRARESRISARDVEPHARAPRSRPRQRARRRERRRAPRGHRREHSAARRGRGGGGASARGAARPATGRARRRARSARSAAASHDARRRTRPSRCCGAGPTSAQPSASSRRRRRASASRRRISSRGSR